MSTAAAATATGAEVAAVDFYAAGYEPGMPISRDEYALLMAHKSEPVFFVSDALGRTPWDKQEAVLESVRDYRETHVAAANGVGKTDTLAEIPLWWLLTGRGIVITTANTWTQVESVLWERIRLIAAEAPEDLGLTFSRTRTDLGEQWFAIGLSTREEARFAGYHEERVLVLVEEAIGVEQPILDAIDGILVGEQDRLVLQGNPLNRDTAWYRRWKQARDLRRRAIAEGRRPDHNTITISAFDTPNVKERRTVIPGMTTHGKVMADIERWGEEDPRTYARVHGLWPPEGSVGLYPLEWLERAYNYDVAEKGPLPGPKRAGLDVARYGNDNNSLAYFDGGHLEELTEWGGVSTMVTAGRALRVMDGKSSDPQSRRVLGRPDVLRVDSLGVGGGPFDRLEELQVETIERQRVHLEEFRAGDPSSDPETFRYLKDEAHWHLRDLLEHDRIDLSKLKPEHREKLESQALAIGYEVNSKGQIVVTDKKGMKKALKGESPDVLEAVVIAAWDDAPYDPPPADERMVTNEAIGAPAPAESRDPGVLDEDELPADPMPGERFFDPVDAL